MNESNTQREHWAVVVGATGKTGEKLARTLAKMNVNLILVDGNKALLHSNANTLHNQYHITVEAILYDNDISSSDSTIIKAIKHQDVGLYLTREYVDNMDASLSNLINMHAIDIRLLSYDAMNTFLEKSYIGGALEELTCMKAA